MNSIQKGKAVVLTVIVVLAALVAMIVLERNVFSLTPGRYLPNGDLSEAQEKAISAMLELASLLMNWSLAVIGAAGVFLKLGTENGLEVQKSDLLLTFLIIFIAVFSLFFGHLLYSTSAELLAMNQFPLSSPVIRVISQCQYVTALGSVGLFGVQIVQFFWSRKDGNR